MLGLLALAAVSVVLAEPPVAGGDRVLDGGGGLAEPDVAGVERVYDDGGLDEGRAREEALAAEWAPEGALAGLAAEAGAGAWTGFLAAEPEDVGRVLDGDGLEVPPVAGFFPTEEGSVGTGAGFFSPAKAGLGRLEEEEEESEGKFASVFSYGAVAAEEEAVTGQGFAVSAGAVPATTTGAAPGFWTM